MAEKFEVEVPIAIKGLEGEKVGKQIGEKIATQLKKTFQTIGVGRKAGGGVGVEGAAGLMGVTKGLKGVATKLGVIGAAIGAAVGLLSKASPYLKGILSLFGRAFMIFFRPFGDFLATLLRPLAILMMKMAVAFLKWTRPITGKVREAVEEVPQIALTGEILADIPLQIANWALKLGAALGTVIYEIGRATFDLGGKIGQWLYDKVIVPAGDFLYSKLFGIWTWTKDFPGWLWNKIIGIWDWTKSLGTWLWGKIIRIWNYTRDFGSWLWTQITNAFKNIGSWLSGVGMYLYRAITQSIKRAFSGFTFGWSWFWRKGQVGIPSVPETGPYILHKGEEVVPRTRAGGNKSIVLSPTFQFSGNVSREADVDIIARRVGRLTEMELKKRGII